MDCETYRGLYPTYSKLPLDREVWDTPECRAHGNHFHECDPCNDWTLAQRVEARGARLTDFPCVHSAYYLTGKLDSTEADPFEDPDIILWQLESSGEIGIPVRDGGSSIIAIAVVLGAVCQWKGNADQLRRFTWTPGSRLLLCCLLQIPLSSRPPSRDP
jgi:hypothetical protein